MDINLPLVLVGLTFVALLIWLYDLILLKPKRAQQLQQLKQKYPDWQLAGSAHATAYVHEAETTAKEPGYVREAKSFLPILLVVLVLRSFLVEPFQIPSSSMEPTLDVGDFILVNKFTYGIRLPVIRSKVLSINEPQRGDVMVFFPPNDDRYFIKRVIGLPGDLIEYRNKQLYINGELQSQAEMTNAPMDFLQRDRMTEKLGSVEHQTFNNPRVPSRDVSVVVQPGHYFMMGDNRDNSSDSRVWGQVPEKNIVGKAFAVWMHWRDWKSLPTFSKVGLIQ